MKDSRTLLLACLTLLACSLTACAPYRPASGKAAYCNQLNSQIIFTGSTSISRQADIQIAEEPMVARSFEKADCQ